MFIILYFAMLGIVVLFLIQVKGYTVLYLLSNFQITVLCFLRGSAGYCFVEMADEASVDRCVQRLNGKLVPGSNPVRRQTCIY